MRITLDFSPGKPKTRYSVVLRTAGILPCAVCDYLCISERAGG